MIRRWDDMIEVVSSLRGRGVGMCGWDVDRHAVENKSMHEVDV